MPNVIPGALGVLAVFAVLDVLAARLDLGDCQTGVHAAKVNDEWTGTVSPALVLAAFAG